MDQEKKINLNSKTSQGHIYFPNQFKDKKYSSGTPLLTPRFGIN